MLHSPEAREKIVAVSELWKSGALQTEGHRIAEWYHGTAFASHKFARARADVPGGPIELLIGILLGYDDLELLNALGVCRGGAPASPRAPRTAHAHLASRLASRLTTRLASHASHPASHRASQRRSRRASTVRSATCRASSVGSRRTSRCSRCLTRRS